MDVIRIVLRGIWDRVGVQVRTAVWIALSAYLTIAGSDGPNVWSPFPRPLAVAAGLAGSVALWWRRERPVGTTVVNGLAVALSANPVPAVVALFTLGTVDRGARLVALTGLVAVGAAVPEWVDGGQVMATELLASCGWAVIAAGTGAYLGARHELLAGLRDRAERAEAERELRAVQAKLAERARIAREMHDVLAHKVSLIALHAGALEVNPGAGPARVEHEAAVIRTTAAQALDELRGVLGALRSGDGDEGLAPQPEAVDIERLVASSHAAGQRVSLSGSVPDMPGATARTVYRVIQESLTNVHKHAAGAVVTITVAGDEVAGLTVTVANRPSLSPVTAAVPALPGSGAGLVGLEERMRLLGGTLSYGPEPDGSWVVTAWLPGWDAGVATGSTTSAAATATATAGAGPVPAGGAEVDTLP